MQVVHIPLVRGAGHRPHPSKVGSDDPQRGVQVNAPAANFVNHGVVGVVLPGINLETCRGVRGAGNNSVVRGLVVILRRRSAVRAVSVIPGNLPAVCHERQIGLGSHLCDALLVEGCCCCGQRVLGRTNKSSTVDGGVAL